MEDIVKCLELAFVGARAVCDVEAQLKISRALAALKAPTSIDIFTQDFMDWFHENETEVHFDQEPLE